MLILNPYGFDNSFSKISIMMQGLSISIMKMIMRPSMILMRRDLMAIIIPPKEASTTMRGAIKEGIMKMTTMMQGKEHGLMTGNLKDPRWIFLSLIGEIHMSGLTRQTITSIPTTFQCKKGWLQSASTWRES